MPTTITSSGITFNDATSQTTSALAANAIGTTQIADGSVNLQKLATTTQLRVAKAWVNFNGTTSPGTIRSSLNVSSVTKNGTGDYTVNFTTPMADANYSAVLGSNPVQGTNGTWIGVIGIQAIATGSVRLIQNALPQDFSIVSAAIFGN